MSRRPTFTQELDLVTLIEDFGSEDKCHAYLERLRWPEGITCPKCDSPKISRIKARRQFDCDACRYQFSVRVGTILQDSHLPLWKWFLATYLMGESKKGVSANQMKRMLNVSYKTAWYLCHRIRAAMVADMAELLTGIVEADETYFGGRGSRSPFGRRASEAGKATILGAVERGGRVRVRMSDHHGAHAQPSKREVWDFLLANLSDDAEALYSDSAPQYEGFEDENTRHEAVNHGIGQWVQADVHTNTIESVWSLFKRSVVGSYHHLSVKHLPAYLDEMAFRYNNRENAYLFRDTLLRLIEAEPLEYADLVAG